MLILCESKLNPKKACCLVPIKFQMSSLQQSWPHKLTRVQAPNPKVKSKKRKGILDSGLSLKSHGHPPPTTPTPTFKHKKGLR